MKNLKILIVENLKNIEISLQSRLSDMGFEVIDQVDSPKKALEILDQRRVDIVLSDLFTDKEINGITLAKSAIEQFKTAVLFLSSESALKHAGLLKEVPFCPLLLKPVKDLELKINIEAAVANFQEQNRKQEMPVSDPFSQYIFVRADYRLNRIRVMDIYYIEAKKDYVSINTGDNVFTVHTTMRDIMNVLPDSHFIRIHRSYIVNIDRIFSIKYPDLLVENKMKTLPIGGLYRKELFDRLNVI